MHHLVFEINLQIHSISLTILVSVHLLMHLSLIIPTLVIHHSFILPLQAQNLPFQQIHRFLLPTGLPHDNGTGPDLPFLSF